MELPFVIGVSPTLKIRGIIAARMIKKDEIIEECPAVIYPINEREHIDKTILENYYFEWSENHDAIALGYGSLLNHSYTPNAHRLFDYERKMIIFIAKRKIEKGEEIMINYNHDTEGPIEAGYLTFDKRLN